jgi:hypothetical protein
LFNTDDFELAVLQEGHCPLCRSTEQQRVRAFIDDDDDDGTGA